MGQENQNEEIDLMQLFGMVKEFFRKFLKLIVDVVFFYKKKFMLFLVLGVLGIVLGFLSDQYLDKKNDFIQEIIIEPNYNSVEYIYDFINDLEDNFKDNNFVNKLGLSVEQVKNVRKIILEPIIQPDDVLTKLEDKESFIEGYNEKLLKEKKYRNFYKQHKLTISFENNNTENVVIADKILESLKLNKYYNKLLDIELRQTKNNLEQSKGSLKFVNDYLTNLSKNPNPSEDKYIFATESETPTISSLLKRKESLISNISYYEKFLELNKEILTIVEHNDIISKRKMLVKRNLLVIPLILIGLTSLLYFSRYLFSSINNFVNND
ncbi:hypothetical protein [Aquimarina sp. AU474]|uniref:hypothetical protein n=1 Tax=Aquimarina sp. AU474 TaxID=2108529 RepID=UPI000D68F663|nr:hypothetical protein [Aquimarina sp. AU474]